MKKFVIIFGFCLAIALAACAAPSTVPSARPAVLRMELPADPEISDLPRIMAADSLRAMGYNVEGLSFDDNALSVQALEKGDLEIGYISSATAWTAIQKGANIRTILDDVSDTRVLAVVPSINACSDLNGKHVAVASATSTQALLLNQYLKTTCPPTTYEPLYISSQTNRLIAITTQQAEGAVVNLANLRELERQENTTIKILVSFARAFPGLRGATIVASRDLREKYPETARDIIRALLQARRKIQDPKVLAEQIVKYLKMEPAEADAAARVYLEQPVWDLNGGLTPQVIQSNIDFFTETGGVQPGLKPADVADLSFLNQVLTEIGFK